MPALGHQRDGLVVHQRAVLDRVDAAADRALDALGAVRVGGDVGAVQRGLLDGGADLVLGELGRRRGTPLSYITAPVAMSLTRSAPP